MAALAPAAPAALRGRGTLSRRPAARVIACASSSPPKRVAVVGAGVAGLTLALALRRLCPSAEAVDVYEAEGDAELRADRGAALNLNGAHNAPREPHASDALATRPPQAEPPCSPTWASGRSWPPFRTRWSRHAPFTHLG
jgi:hypothetical protein